MATEAKKKGNFLKEVRAELKKVNWPNKKDLKKYTFVVINMCLIVSFAIYLFDTLFRGILHTII